MSRFLYVFASLFEELFDSAAVMDSGEEGWQTEIQYQYRDMKAVALLFNNEGLCNSKISSPAYIVQLFLYGTTVTKKYKKQFVYLVKMIYNRNGEVRMIGGSCYGNKYIVRKWNK